MNKTIKIFLMAVVAAVAGSIASCTDYQDEIDALKNRVDTLYTLQDRVQNNLNNLETLIIAMEDHWYVVGWAALPDEDGDGVSDGYVINLRKDKYDPNTGEVIESQKEEKTITIKNGKKGDDAQFPDITAQQNKDGGWWFWVIKNPTTGKWEPITDENGDTIKVAQDGQDATSPQVEIKWDSDHDNGDGTKGGYVWFTSTDGGTTWVSTGVSAVGSQGPTGPKGATGPDGDDAESPIISVKLTVEGSNSFLEIVLKNGSVVKVPVTSFHLGE